MAKPKVTKFNTKIQKSPVNSKWFNNVAKSMGILTTDLIKGLTPNTTDFLDYNASDTMDMVRDMRSNVGGRSNVNRQVSNIPQINIGKDALKNALNDIKSGNLNNTARAAEFADDMDFDFGGLFEGDDNVSFDEEEVSEGADVTVNQYKTNNVLDTLPLAKAMSTNAEATINAISAVAEQNIAMESEKLMFSHKSLNTMSGGLTAINDNLATLVKFHGDSTTKYYAASIKYYEESLDQLKQMQKAGQTDGGKKNTDEPAGFTDSLYTYTGGLKVNAYAKVIKENLKAIRDENAALASMTDMLTDTSTLAALAKNPIGTMAKIGMKAMVPVATKASLQAIDASMSAIIPAFMSKINSMEDSDNPIMEYMYKAFGSKNKLSYSVKLGEYEKGPQSWDGQDKKTLNEVLPAYLRRIEAALTGKHERIYDYKEGMFTTSKDLKKRYDDNLSEVEGTGFSEARLKMREVVRSMNANAEVMKQFEKDMKEYFSAMTKKGSVINPFLRKDKDGFTVDEMMDNGLFDNDEDRIELMRKAMKGLSTKELSNMATMGIYDSRQATQRYMDEIRKNPSLSGHATLFNGGMYKDGKLTYDPTKGGKSDSFGKTSNDYLRDIRGILATGIAVYSPAKNPHQRSLRKFASESTSAVISGNSTTGGQLNELFLGRGTKDMGQLLKMSNDEMANVYRSVQEPLEKGNKISDYFGKKTGRANQYVNTMTGMIDNKVYQVLFGDDPENAAKFLSNKNMMKNMLEEDSKRGGGMLGKTIGFFQDTIKGVGSYFTGQGYIKSDGTKVSPTNDSILGKMKGFFSGSVDKLVGKKGDKEDLGLMGKVSKDFMDGFEQFKKTLFGEKTFGDKMGQETMSELTGKIKSRLPKSIGAGLMSGAVKTLFASKMGLLGSMLLPGGPIGAVLTGTTVGFLSQSETFKKWLFGEKNDKGYRMGGFIPKSLSEKIENSGGSIKKGAIVGGAVGMLPSFFLPGGPITGAVMGMGASMMSKSDKFQEMLYGEDFKNSDKKKSIMNGTFGKIYKNTIGKATKDANPKLATFLGGAGMAAGIAQGVGLLPSFLLPGGPITGAMLGLAGGIMSSSDKFQQFLFGDKDIDGKRYGGIMTKFTNWFDTTVVSPFKIKATEINDNIYEFVQGKMVQPLVKAFEPMTQAFKFVVDDAKEAMKNTWAKLTDGIIGSFNDNVIKPFGESLEKYVVDPLKKSFNVMLKMIGKGLGALVTSPIKLLTGVGNLANAFNERHVMKDERRNRRANFKNMLSEKRADGTLGFKDIMGGLRSQFIFGKEKEDILNDKLEYRRGASERDAERKAKLEEEMNKRRSATADMRRQYEEDRKFGKKSNWKYASKKQKAEREEDVKQRTAWYQEQLAIKSDETVKKLNDIDGIIKEVPSYEKDKKNLLMDIKIGLHDTLDYLKELNGDSIKSNAKGAINKLGETLKNKGQSHADGLDKVPEDGYVAELHEGEMVVPKKGAGALRSLFGMGKKDGSKNSIVSTLTNKVSSLMNKEKSDRADNRFGFSQLEQQQAKEFMDLERYQQASRKGVDFIQAQMLNKKKEKEDKKFKSQLLATIKGNGDEVKKGNSFWENLFSGQGLLGKFFGGIAGFGKKLLSMLGGLGGLLGAAGIGAAAAYYTDSKGKAKEAGVSTLEYMHGVGDEGQLNGEGLYEYNNTPDAILKTGLRHGLPKAIEVGKPIAKNTANAYQAAKTGAKTGLAKFDAYANPKKVSNNVIGKGYSVDTPRKGMQKPAGMISDFTKTTKKKAGETMSMLIDLAGKAMNSLESLVAKKFPSVKGLSSKASGLFKTLSKDADTIVKRFGKKISLFFADGAADFIPVVGQVAEAAMTVWDLGTGLTKGNTANLFQVGPDDVDMEMRLITSVLQGACKFSWFSIIWMINEICSSMYDFSFLTQIARTIYDLIPQDTARKIDMKNDIKTTGDAFNNASLEDLIREAAGPMGEEAVKALGGKDLSKLKASDLKKYGISATELQELERKQYNDKNGTKMDKQGYTDHTSKTVGQKIMGSKTMKNIKGTFSKTSARGHLGLNKDAEMSYKERKGFAMAKTGINSVNFFRKLFGKEEIDDKEVFQGKYYDKNGKLTLNKKNATMSYAEAREKKEQDKVDKANAKINKRLEDEPKSGIGKWWNNMMIGVQKGKREKARKRIGTKETKKKTSTKTKAKQTAAKSPAKWKDYNSTSDGGAQYDAMADVMLTGSAGKGDDVKTVAKQKAANPAKKKAATANPNIKSVNTATAQATKSVDSLYKKLSVSINQTANKLTKGLSMGQKTLTSAFDKLQKALISSSKVTSSRLKKTTRSGEKDLDKMSKNLVKDSKNLFSTLKKKVDDTLKSIKNIKITTPSTVSPTFTVDNPKTFMTDLFTDVMKKVEESKDKKKKKSNNAGSSGISSNLAQKNNKESGNFINPTNTTTTNNSTSNKFVFYSQNDEKWSNKKLVGDKTIAQAGCGPTSIAMAVSQMTGEQVTPDIVAELGKKDLPGYSTYNLFPEIAKKFAMNYEDTENAEDIVRYLREGTPVMLSGVAKGNGVSPYTQDGHVVVANSIKGDQVFVSDPRGKGYSKSYNIADLTNGLNKAMVMKPTTQTKNRMGISRGQIRGVNGQYVGSLNKDLQGLNLSPGELNKNFGSDGQMKLFEKVLAYAKLFEGKLTYSQPRRAEIDNNGLAADCSSFTHHVFKNAAGVEIGANSSAQHGAGSAVGLDQAQSGDLIVFDGHAGIVWDNNQMIDIGSGMGPKIRSFRSSYWMGRNPKIRRVLSDPNQTVDNVIANANKALGTNTVNGLNLQGVSGGAAPTSGGEESSVEMMGVFDSMTKFGQNLVASAFNGKAVDMFASSSSSGGTTGGSTDISGMSDTKQAVWKFFTGMGYSPEATAGIMGNMQQESGIDPKKIQGNGKGPAAGISQWENYNSKSARWKKMSDYAGSKGKDWTDLQAQLEYIDMELGGVGSVDKYTSSLLNKKIGGLAQFKSLKDIGKATEVFENSFERAGIKVMDKRKRYATDIYNQMKGSGGGTTTTGTAGGDPGNTAGSSGIPDSMNGWAYYKQGDPRWNTSDIGGSTVARAGCGPTSHAMMLSTMFGQNIRPDTMTRYGLSNGGWSSAGMSWSMPQKVAKDFGLSLTNTISGHSDSSLSSVKNEIKSGRPVIMSGRGISNRLDSPFTTGGHIVLGVGVDGNNNIIINDPRDPKYTKSYSDEDLKRGADGLRMSWSFAKNGNSKIPQNIATDGTFTPGAASSTGDGTTSADAPSVELLGVFDSMNKFGQNLMASVFNGKAVDMFASSGGSSTGGATGGVPDVDYAKMTESQESFFQTLAPGAKAAYNQYKVFPSTTLAQAALESGWGKSRVAREDKNLFGVKYTGRFAPGLNVTKGLNCPGNEQGGARPYNRYQSVGDSLIDHGWFLANNSRYAKALQASNAYDQIDAIAAAGYAETGNYGSMLKNMVKKYGLPEKFDQSGSAGMGDGKTHIIRPAVDKNAKSTTKVNYSLDNRIERAGKGELAKVQKAQRDALRTIGNSYKLNSGNGNNATVTATNACMELMSQIVAELAAIRTNTGITAENTKEIKVVSANEPIGDTNNTNPRQTNNTKRMQPSQNTGYDLARSIASFSK